MGMVRRLQCRNETIDFRQTLNLAGLCKKQTSDSGNNFREFWNAMYV